MSDKRDKQDERVSGMAVIDSLTKIHGPSAEELRRPFQKSLDQIARELQQGHAEAVRKFSNGGKV